MPITKASNIKGLKGGWSNFINAPKPTTKNKIKMPVALSKSPANPP